MPSSVPTELPPARYDDIVAVLEGSGMVARGGFVPGPGDGVPSLADGRDVGTVVMIGNIGGAMWPRFAAERADVADPLDTWTRAVLAPIAASFGADFVHPSDEPFRPFQRWAQRADDVFPSPIGLLVHPEWGLWHAYRGAFLFPGEVSDLPPVGLRVSPCVSCIDRPCLTSCPVGAFDDDGYDRDACADHVASGGPPACLTEGCAARRSCPVNTDGRYGPEQMLFHMRAFMGWPSAG